MTGPLQVVLGTISVVFLIVAVVLATRAVRAMIRIIRTGQPDGSRRGPFAERIKAMLVESLGHTRMLKWSTIGVAHWFVFVGFYGLFLTLVQAFGEVWNPAFELPIIGNFFLWNWFVDLIGALTVVGILYLIYRRQKDHPRRAGRASRFAGSNEGRGYFVEAVVLIIGICILSIRAAAIASGLTETPAWQHPISSGLSNLFPSNPDLVSVIAFVKVVVSLIWLVVIARILNMGVAWHRFSAFFNIYFKRDPRNDAPALGPLQPMMSNGAPIDFEDPGEDDVFGRGTIEDFTWKGMLDFTTCTECGRCQSQCPAWNTGKPLSPKLVIMDLRDHLFAKAPYLLDEKPRPDESSVQVTADGAPHVPESGFARVTGSGPEQAARPLVGTAEEGGVIDPDVLWSCTTCGACVEQCPVDIEHIDHIVDMRRYQVMMESEFPAELGVLFKNLETKGNPWGQNAKDRTNWIDEVEFDVPVFGKDVDSFEGYEYLFWVGCAGAYEDRAKKTTKAVAELLAAAGVKYLVLGEGETCNGDSARRSGNEFLFQQLAAQNVETLNGLFEGVERVDRKVVVTCP